MKNYFGIWGKSFVLAGLLAWAPASQAQILKVGDTAPDFSLEALDGGTFSLNEFKGQVVFIVFFGYN